MAGSRETSVQIVRRFVAALIALVLATAPIVVQAAADQPMSRMMAEPCPHAASHTMPAPAEKAPTHHAPGQLCCHAAPPGLPMVLPVVAKPEIAGATPVALSDPARDGVPPAGPDEPPRRGA